MEIYEPKGRAREYSPLALNYYKGCSHGCSYCYVPNMLGRFNASYIHSNVKVDINFDRIDKSAKKYAGCGKQVLLSFTGDPYCGIQPEVTTEVLKILNKYEHKVAILTKGGSRALEDMSIISKFGNRIKVGATLVFDNINDSLEWEPGAASPNDRVESLKEFAKAGVKTWASFEPVIKPDQSLNLLNAVSGFINHVKIGKINNYKGIDKDIDWRDFLYNAVSICRNTNLLFYVKNDLSYYNNDIFLNDYERDCDYLNL